MYPPNQLAEFVLTKIILTVNKLSHATLQNAVAENAIYWAHH